MQGFLGFVGVVFLLAAWGNAHGGHYGAGFVLALIGGGALFLASCFEDVDVTDVRVGRPRKEKRFRWPV